MSLITRVVCRSSFVHIKLFYSILSITFFQLVENFAWDEKNLLTKTKSDVSLSGAIGCNVCSQGVQV